MPLNPETATVDEVVDLIISNKPSDIKKFVKAVSECKLSAEKKLDLFFISPIKKPKTLVDIIVELPMKTREEFFKILIDCLNPNTVKRVLEITKKKNMTGDIIVAMAHDKKFKTIINLKILLLDRLLDYQDTVIPVYEMLDMGHLLAANGDHSCLVNYLNLLKKLIHHKAHLNRILNLLKHRAPQFHNTTVFEMIAYNNFTAIETLFTFLDYLQDQFGANTVLDLISEKFVDGNTTRNFAFHIAKHQNSEATYLCFKLFGKLIKGGCDQQKLKQLINISHLLGPFDSSYYGKVSFTIEIYNKKKDIEITKN